MDSLYIPSKEAHCVPHDGYTTEAAEAQVRALKARVKAQEQLYMAMDDRRTMFYPHLFSFYY